ncbi:MAG: hypothetical protein QGF46_00525 [Planctomycetota bacterium]|jgi:hypothetical protein|nr:hypothetical protein [Planctomycetota bacterium]
MTKKWSLVLALTLFVGQMLVAGIHSIESHQSYHDCSDHRSSFNSAEHSHADNHADCLYCLLSSNVDCGLSASKTTVGNANSPESFICKPALATTCGAAFVYHRRGPPALI